MKSVFVNPERCIGCRQCEIACAVAHSLSGDLIGALSEEPRPQSRIHVEAGGGMTAFPARCRRCVPAPCQMVCAGGAIGRDEARGVVTFDERKCISCAMCAMVCPFGAVTYHVSARVGRKVAMKCDGCEQRLAQGRVPACVEACKTDALVFGKLDDLIRAGRLKPVGQVLAAPARLAVSVISSEAVDDWHAYRRIAGALEDEDGGGHG